MRMQEADKRRRAQDRADKKRQEMQDTHLRTGVLGAAQDAENEDEGELGAL